MSPVQSAPVKERRSDFTSKRIGSPLSGAPRLPWPVRQGDRPLPVSLKKGSRPIGRPAAEKQNAVAAARRSSALAEFFSSISLERSFILIAFVVAALVMSLFGLDLALGWPFRRASLLFDTTSMVCGAGLAYLSWDVFLDQVRGKAR